MRHRLNHPGICTVYAIEQQELLHFIAMELPEGETLALTIERGPLPAGDLDSGYNFSSWTAANCTLANPSASSTTCTITGAGNAAVTAIFAAIPCYTLSKSASPAAGGSVTINTSQNCPGGFTSGTAVSVTVSPNGTYTFSNWTATNCTLANANTASTTCTMTGAGNGSVTAKFRKH